jgi:hypothetical protein
MNPAEKLRKFAAECQAMTKFARSPESKATWSCLAARWVQCAELVERHSSAAMLNRMGKRHRRPALSWSRSGNVEVGDLSCRKSKLDRARVFPGTFEIIRQMPEERVSVRSG